MIKYISKKLLNMVITLFIIITIVFFLIRLVPGDPLAIMADRLPMHLKQNFYEKYGLNRPILEQYFFYMKKLISGDLGISLVQIGKPIREIITEAAPVSGKLNIQALFLGVSSGIILGVLAAYKRNKWPDFLVMFIAVLGVSLPSFVIATSLQYFLTVKYRVFPTIGWSASEIKFSILPIMALCLSSIATYARYLRASVLEVLGQDYILTAKAKGVTGFRLITKHVLRNALLPAITILGPEIGGIFIGSFVIESIFSIPGFGQIYVDAISSRDFTLILGQTILLNSLYIFSLFFVDVLYGIVDPRIKIFNKEN